MVCFNFRWTSKAQWKRRGKARVSINISKLFSAILQCPHSVALVVRGCFILCFLYGGICKMKYWKNLLAVLLQ